MRLLLLKTIQQDQVIPTATECYIQKDFKHPIYLCVLVIYLSTYLFIYRMYGILVSTVTKVLYKKLCILPWGPNEVSKMKTLSTSF